MTTKTTKTKRKPRCKKGQILRAAYTTKRGVHVPAKCIKDRGKKGKGPYVLPKPSNKQPLVKLGYRTHFTDAKRHAALRKAVNKYTYATTIHYLGLGAKYNKRISPKASKTFIKDMKWLHKIYRKN